MAGRLQQGGAQRAAGRALPSGEAQQARHHDQQHRQGPRLR
ncbi:hypothetical protein [Streptomyces viridosporus]